MIIGHKISPCLTLLKGILEDSMTFLAEDQTNYIILLETFGTKHFCQASKQILHI